MQIIQHVTRMLSCLFFILLLITLSPPVKTWAYTPPIGIPDPGMWGTTHPIDSSAPDTTIKCPSWPAAQTANCYYIDNKHPQATDTSNTYGYPNKPRLSFPTTFTAGAYIEVHGGPYTKEKVYMYFNGTSESPIWFRGTQSEMPIITGRFIVKNSSYVIFEYLDFNGGYNGATNGVENPRIFEGGWPGNCIIFAGDYVDHAAIRNSNFRQKEGTGSTAAIDGHPADHGTMHDIVVFNNLFYTLGDWTGAGDEDFHGVFPELYGNQASVPPVTLNYNWWILENTGYNISGNLVQVNGGSDGDQGPPGNRPYLHHIYIGKNVGHHNRQAIVGIKQSTDVIVSQNTTFSNYKVQSAEGTGIAFQYDPDYLWIIFNKIYDVDNGIRQSATIPGNEGKHAYIVGNIVYNVHYTPPETVYSVNNIFKYGAAIPFWHGSQVRYIVDNTTYNSYSGTTIASNLPGGSTTYSGNVFTNIVKTDDYHITAFSDRELTHLDHTFFQPNTNGNVRFKWDTVYESLSSFQSSTGECQNCWQGDPGFIDSVHNDFHPAEGSPLIGKGIRHPVYDEFQTRYGLNIAYDFDGKPRPTGAWTLGALEPGPLKTMNLPAPPAPVPDVIK